MGVIKELTTEFTENTGIYFVFLCELHALCGERFLPILLYIFG
jgi:hypothetical protein